MKSEMSATEKAADLKEAAQNREHHRKVARKNPGFKRVAAPGIHEYGSSYRAVAAFYVGSYETLAKAKAAREAFIRKVDKVRG